MKILTPEQKIKLAKMEMWWRGSLVFKFHKAQKLINSLYNKIKSQLFVGNCSRQWGKSFWAACKAIETALAKPNANIIYGAAFYKDLIKYIIPAFKKIMEDCPNEIKGKYSSSSFTFPNGSIINLVGIDKNPDGLRGNTIDLVIIDEAGYVKDLDYLYNSVLIPATLHRPNSRIIFISTPPNTPDHPFKEFCIQAEKDGSYGLFTIYDNPMLTKEAILKLQKKVEGGVDGTTWKREFLCKFVTDSNLKIIPEWLETDEWDAQFIQDLPKDEFYQFYHKYVTMDLGFVDFTALIFGYYDFKRAAIVIEDELHAHGPAATTKTLNAQIREIEKRLWGELPPYRRISDNNNPQLLNEFTTEHKLNFYPTNKDSLDAMVNEVRLWAGAGRIIVHPRCVQTIGCLKYGVWDSKKRMFARSKTYGHYDHLAALIYMIRNIDTRTNPIPATHNFDPYNTWNYKALEEQGKNNVLTKAIFPKFKQPQSRRV